MLWMLLLGANPPCTGCEDLAPRCSAGDASACAALGKLAIGNMDEGLAATWWESCTLQDATSCLNRGVLAVQAGADASSWFRQSCELGSAKGCLLLGDLFREGRGVGMDANRALGLYRKACEMGWGEGCYSAGVITEGGGAVSADKAAAMELYEKGCKQGDAASCGQQGFLLGMPDGKVFLEKGCSGKDGYSCFLLGKSLSGVAATPYFEEACKSGLGEACTLSGARWESGEAGRPDAAMALRFYEEGCRRKDVIGCTLAGVLLLPTKPEEAYSHFKQSCSADEPAGCFNQASLLLDGTGVLADPAAAYPLFLRACTLHNGEACAALSQMWEHGIGVEKDRKAAKMWELRACSEGYRPACR